MVRNLKTGKNGMITLDVIAREPSQLRMELTGPFNVHVASVAMSGPEVRYILTQQKRFVEAPADADSLNRLVPVRISPKVLMAVLFERRLPETEWKCDREAQSKLPIECVQADEGIVVRWIERNGRNRRVKIGAPEAEVEMVIDEAKSKVEMNEETFTLAPPNGYKQERMRSRST